MSLLFTKSPSNTKRITVFRLIVLGKDSGKYSKKEFLIIAKNYKHLKYINRMNNAK